MNIKDQILKVVGDLKVALSAEPIEPAEIPAEVEMKEATLSDGTLVKYDNLEVGSNLIAITVEGELPAPDGVHEFEDGTMVTTVDGLITEVVEGEPIEEVVEEENGFDQKFADLLRDFAQLKKQSAADKLEFAETLKSHNESVLASFEKVAEMVTLASETPSSTPIAQPRGSVLANLRAVNKR